MQFRTYIGKNLPEENKSENGWFDSPNWISLYFPFRHVTAAHEYQSMGPAVGEIDAELRVGEKVLAWFLLVSRPSTVELAMPP